MPSPKHMRGNCRIEQPGDFDCAKDDTTEESAGDKHVCHHCGFTDCWNCDADGKRRAVYIAKERGVGIYLKSNITRYPERQIAGGVLFFPLRDFAPLGLSFSIPLL